MIVPMFVSSLLSSGAEQRIWHEQNKEIVLMSISLLLLQCQDEYDCESGLIH